MPGTATETEEARFYHVFPQNCFLPGPVMGTMQLHLLPTLRETMTDEEIIAAHNWEEPWFSQMKKICCKGCNEYRCPNNFKPERNPNNPFRELQNGRREDRDAAGERLLEELLPKQRRDELEQQGIECSSIQIPSRKHPSLGFHFNRGEEKRSIQCHVGSGDKALWINNEKSPQPLETPGQISEAINKVVADLLAT